MGKKKNRNDNKGKPKSYSLDHYPMNNEKLFSFYKQQPIIPPEEYEQFIETLKVFYFMEELN